MGVESTLTAARAAFLDTKTWLEGVRSVWPSAHPAVATCVTYATALEAENARLTAEIAESLRLMGEVVDAWKPVDREEDWEPARIRLGNAIDAMRAATAARGEK